MAGKYTLKQFEADQKARQEKKEKEARERQERWEKDNARRAYLGEGGTEEEFERNWPEIHEEMRRQRVMRAE